MRIGAPCGIPVAASGTMDPTMSVLDRVRSLPAPPRGGPAPWRRWRCAADGALAAGIPWAACVALALVAWVASPEGAGGGWQTVGVASAAWLLGGGASLSAGSVSVSLVPLGVWGASLWWTGRRLRGALARAHADAAQHDWPTTRARTVLPQLAIGYAVPVVVASLLTLAGPVRPSLLGLLTAFSVPALAVVVEGARDLHHADGLLVPVGWQERVPLWLRRGLRPGLEAATALVGIGALVLVVALLMRGDVVLGLYSSLAPGWVGAVVLTVGQLLYLPNLAVWSLSWVAGPGLQVAAGSTVTVNGAAPGLLPMVPVLGALPTEGVYPRWVSSVLLLPVLVGGVLGWRAAGEWTRLAAWREKARTAATAVVTATVTVTLAAALGSGSVGVDRLAEVGVPVLGLAAAVLGELALGAGLYLLGVLARARLGP